MNLLSLFLLGKFYSLLVHWFNHFPSVTVSVSAAFPLPFLHFTVSFLLLSFALVQFSTSVTLAAPMEPPLQAQYGPPLEPLGFSLGHPTKPLSHMDPESCQGLNTEHESLHGSFSSNGSCTSDGADSSTAIDSTFVAGEEEECLVDSQPICFKENPFLVANRKGKSLPAGEKILSGPPVGYGRPGQLQPWLYSKARSCLRVVWRQHGVLLHTVCCAHSNWITRTFSQVTLLWCHLLKTFVLCWCVTMFKIIQSNF